MNEVELFEYKPATIEKMKEFLLHSDSDCTLILKYEEASILFIYI